MKKIITILILLWTSTLLISCGIKHNVKFMINNEVYKEFNISDGSKIKEFEEPKIENSIFLYWEYEMKEFSFNSKINQDMILTAIFIADILEDDIEGLINNSFATNNYELYSEIVFYDELKESALIQIDNNYTWYEDSNVTEFYYRNKDKIDIYRQIETSWVKLSSKKNEEKISLFDLIKNNNFLYKNNNFKIKEESINSLNEYFDLEIEYHYNLEDFQINIKNQKVESIVYIIEIDRLKYNVKMSFSKYGEIQLSLPTV